MKDKKYMKKICIELIQNHCTHVTKIRLLYNLILYKSWIARGRGGITAAKTSYVRLV